MLKDPAFTRGFDTIAHLPTAWGISRAGVRLSEKASGFIETHRDDRFFLYLHYLDPHGPYDPPDERYLALAGRKYETQVSLYGDVRPRCTELVQGGFGPGDARFEDLVLRYDAEILDTDAAIGAMMGSLRRLGLSKRTLVVVTADHGEEFLEHGFVEHAWTLYRESLHIPLLIWAPAALEPRQVRARVSAVERWLEPAERPAAVKKEKQIRESTRGKAFPMWGTIVHEELRSVSRTRMTPGRCTTYSTETQTS